MQPVYIQEHCFAKFSKLWKSSKMQQGNLYKLEMSVNFIS